MPSILCARSTMLLVALAAAAGCATGRELGPRLDELKAEQARQGTELAELRRRVDELQQRAPTRPAKPDPSEVKAVPLEDSPVDGPDDAWVTVVEFTDFQCPFCGRAQPTLRNLREQYGAAIRFVVKHNPLPFHA